MTTDKNDMLVKLRSLSIKDHYAVFGAEKREIANIGELMRSAENDAMLCFCGREEKHRRGESADFEYFRECVRMLPMLKGTHSYDITAILLYELCDASSIPENGFSDEEICELWRTANDKRFESNNEKYFGEKSYLADKLDLNISCDGKCYYSASEDIVICNYTKLGFIRPDPYHSQLLRNKEKCGEKLQNDEISLIITQNIYDILSKNNCGKTQLHLRFGNDAKTVRQLIGYLKKQKLTAQIFVAYENEAMLDDVVELCLMSDQELRISPEIVITEKDSMANLCRRLRLLFAVYPASKTRFGGAVTGTNFLLGEHLLFRKALLRVLSEMLSDKADVYEVAKKIL